MTAAIHHLKHGHHDFPGSDIDNMIMTEVSSNCEIPSRIKYKYTSFR